MQWSSLLVRPKHDLQIRPPIFRRHICGINDDCRSNTLLQVRVLYFNRSNANWLKCQSKLCKMDLAMTKKFQLDLVHSSFSIYGHFSKYLFKGRSNQTRSSIKAYHFTKHCHNSSRSDEINHGCLLPLLRCCVGNRTTNGWWFDPSRFYHDGLCQGHWHIGKAHASWCY